MTENYFLYVGTEGGNLLTTNQDSNLKAKKNYYASKLSEEEKDFMAVQNKFDEHEWTWE